MANFRAYPGLHVKFVKDTKTMKIGDVRQILHAGGSFRDFITVIGSSEIFNKTVFAQSVEPIYDYEEAQ